MACGKYCCDSFNNVHILIELLFYDNFQQSAVGEIDIKHTAYGYIDFTEETDYNPA